MAVPAATRIAMYAILAALATALAAAPPARADVSEERARRAAAEQVCAARDPACDWIATLSSLERASVSRALVARGYELEPEPWGKLIRRVHVYNEDVFAEKSRLLQFFNRFHYTTRERVTRYELVIREGEVWDQARVDETARRLRDPMFTSVIAVVPVRSGEPGTVDMLVVTRDIWSLRLNTQYSFQTSRERSKLTGLALSLSENNFFGTRTVVAAAVTMDQSVVAAGPLIIDKNVLGKYVELRARFDTILNRDDLLNGNWNREGTQSTISIQRSLWRLASEWGAGATFGHRNAIIRSFAGFDVRQIHCPIGGRCSRQYDPATTPADELLPSIYYIKRMGVSAYAVRQFDGAGLKHQVTIGHSLDSARPRLLASFPGTEEQRQPFIDEVLPRSEVTSAPYISYGFFDPDFRKLRNVSTYDLIEDARLGPALDLTFGVGRRELGSTYDFSRASAGASWGFPWCRDGLWRVSAGIGLRHLGGEFIDNTASGTLRLVSPTYWFARVVAQATVATRWNDTQNAFFTIGSDDGLRGFAVDEYNGQRLARGNVELRTLPRALWMFRYGGVLFYDVGGAADRVSEIRINQDVGLGLRVLVPQTSRELFRFDLAFPLNDGPGGTRAGIPRFIAGFQSEF